MIRVKPLFKYAGGKVLLLKTYYPFFQGLRPQYCVDYCGGSGTMSLWFHQLFPEAKLYLNEKDQAIYKLFTCIKENYEEFCQEMAWLEEGIQRKDGLEGMKEWYYSLRDECYNQTQDPSDEWFQADLEAHPEDYDDLDLKDVERWARCSLEGLSQRKRDNIICEYWNGWSLKEWEDMTGQNTPFEHACYLCIRRMCFSGVNQRNRRGHDTTGHGIISPTQRCYDPETVATFKAMLDHAELFNHDYRELDFPFPRSLHYFDPPYLGSADNLFTSRFSWDETEALCGYVQRLAEHSTVFMSNYDHPQLKKLMKGFDWYTFPTRGRLQAQKQEPVRETLFYKIHPSITG